MQPDVIPCVLVRLLDGRLVWIPAAEYRLNPDHGSYVVRDSWQR